MTKAELARRSGVAKSSIDNWEQGRGVPRRPKVAALVEALDAPELFEAFKEITPTMISMWCAHCTRTKDIPANSLRRSLKEGGFPGAVVEWRSSRGSYRYCARCASSIRMAERNAKIVKRHGRRALVERGLRTAQAIPVEEKVRRGRTQGLANRGLRRTAEQRLNISRGRVRSRLPGRWYTCEVCRKTGYVSPKDDREQFAHVACGGGTAGRRGRPRELAESYELAVRHRLRREPLRSLAEELGYGPDEANLEGGMKVMLARIKRFVDSLPDDERGGALLLRRARHLRGETNF